MEVFRWGFTGTGVYNGDIGVVTAIEDDVECLTVDYDGHQARYGFEMLNELEHAWAMTVHKSQGSEYRAVILALNSGAQALLTRGVVYRRHQGKTAAYSCGRRFHCLSDDR